MCSGTASSATAHSRNERCCRLSRYNDFACSIRVESLIAEFSGSSGGASTMASVCGGTLAMMDAGASVRHVARRRRHGSLILPDGNVDETTLGLGRTSCPRSRISN